MADKLYEVESVTSRTILTPQNRFEKVFEVAIVTASGVRDTVTVAEKDYQPEKVKALLQEAAVKHEAVMKG